MSALSIPRTYGATADYQGVLDRLRAAQSIPGVSAVVVRDNEVAYAGGSGVADLETGHPVNADTVYYIGSVTKVLTSIMTLHLVEQDELELRTPLASVVENLDPAYPPISIFHLLTHSSGLKREGNFGYWFNARFPDRDALFAYLLSTTPGFEPGAKRQYSNIGFAALGLVVESVTRQSFDLALEARVLEPLGMHATGVADPPSGISNGYTPPGRIMPSADRPFAGVGEAIGDRYERVYHDAGAMSPAFGAYSTARDMGRLALFMLNNGGDEVLTRAARERMRERQPLGGGLGIGLKRKNGRMLMVHGGWFAAHRSHLIIDADSGIAVVVLANSDSASPDEIADALYTEAIRVTNHQNN